MTKTETRTCQNCHEEFAIEPEDFGFYEKMGVLSPRLCPACRAQRRLAFRNERSFYSRKCDKCGKDGISMYSPNKPYAVWCHDCWFSDGWDGRDLGIEYDPAKPFLNQFAELWNKVPKVGLMHERSVNSEYVNISADNKNCYMLVESSNNEGCTHCYWIQECKDCVDTSFASKTELSYESDDCYNSYRLFWSKGCHDSHDGYFLLDCRGCSNCVGCVNLFNKQYHIFNKPVSKEDYEKFLEEARFDTWTGLEAFKKKFEDFAMTEPRRFAQVYNSPGSSGNYIEDAKNCKSCFHCYDSEDSKYGVHIWRNAKDCVDADTAGRSAELVYNSINAGIDVSHYVATAVCWSSSFMDYSFYCFNCTNCFGCTGLRKQNYCILNKQYSPEEYGTLRKEIIAKMREEGIYGEFFPASVSAFGYNETAAEGQFPLTKEEALRQGFKWEDHPRGTYGKETMPWDKIPDSIRDIGGIDVPKEIFACTKCKKNFRIIPSEFEFYKHLEIPLPRECPDCRHERRFAARGPNKTWHRNCMCDKTGHDHSGRCPNEFETSFSPENKEIIYCEGCYQKEIV